MISVYNPSDYPHINFSKTFNILDSSKISTFMRCRRKFLFEYILGLRSIYPNRHLIYGTAIHLALESILLESADTINDMHKCNQAILNAYNLALDLYRESFPNPEDDEFRKPKSPEYIIPSLLAYIDLYRDEWETEELIATELHGTVPIDEAGIMVTYRNDAIRRNRAGQLYVLEHKTGSQAGSAWYDQWLLAVQPLVYYHALRYNYPNENTWGVMINGIIAAKRKNVTVDGINLHRVPVRYTDKNMIDGLATLSEEVTDIHQNMETLQRATPADPRLNTFRRCATSCTDFNSTCMYHTLCTLEPNPVKLASQIKDDPNNIPEGFQIEHWNPLDEAKAEVT